MLVKIHILHHSQQHTHRIRAITFNHPGKLFASSSDDFNIKLWEVETQKCLQNFWRHQGEIRALTFIPPSSTQAEILVSASDDNTIYNRGLVQRGGNK